MKLAVVYWSGTGNTEAMAQQVVAGAQNAGAEVTTFGTEFSAANVAEYDAIAFGCPAMGAENLEEGEFEPMFSDLEGSLSGKKVGLFGSYGWGGGQWMDDWKSRTEADGAFVIGTVIANEYPDDAANAQCMQLGEDLTK